MNPDNLIDQIHNTLTEAASAVGGSCQHETLKWLSDLDVDGPTAKIRFGFKISDTRLEINNRPGMLANCASSETELEAPAIFSTP